MKHFLLQHFHMCVLLLRVFSSILVPVGIWVLSKGVRMLRKSYTGPLLLEMPLTRSAGEFEVAKAGIYAIWQKSPLIWRRPIETIGPHILDRETNMEIPLLQSLSGKKWSNRTEGRIEIYTFQAPAGRYRMEIASDLPLSRLDAFMEGVFPLPLNPTEHFLQIRETQPGYRSLLGFLLSLAGLLVTVGGLFLIAMVEWIVVL